MNSTESIAEKFSRLIIELSEQDLAKRRERGRVNQAKWRATNPERSKMHRKLSILRNPERHRLGKIASYHRHKAKSSARAKQYRLENKELLTIRNKRAWANVSKEQREAQNAKSRKWYSKPENKQRVLSKQRRYQQSNKDLIRKQGIKYRQNLSEEQKAEVRRRANNYVKARVKIDPVFRLMRSFRCRLAIFITKPYRKSGMNELIGCNGQDLRKHLESLWKPGMTWDTYGRNGWVVDHKKPLSSFDLSNADELKQAWHFSNLQPMPWLENLAKNARLDYQPA